MKIAKTEVVITPELGTTIAGYGPYDETFRIVDDLVLSLLALDDGKNKALILGYDLIGLDEALANRLRSEAAKALGVSDEYVILSCTHTHQGPHTRTLSRAPETFNTAYAEKLVAWTLEGVEKLKGTFVEAETYFYSMKVDANTNRRFVGRDNRGRFFPHHRDMEALADEYCDQEL